MSKSKDKIKHLQTRVDLEEHQVVNTHSSDYPRTFSDNLATKWTPERFQKDVEFKIVHEEDMHLEFDLIGADAALANALRRIILVEVPTMAIEKVFVYNNTSIMQDEVLAHRLGLIPLKADPRLFEYRQEGQEESSAEDTLSFGLTIKCSHNSKAPADATKPDDLYQNNNVYSKSIVWLPISNQSDLFKEPDVLPVNDDILITKLRPGQILDLRMEAYKGIGQDHIKFSPVATVSYRLLPEITLTQPVTGKLINKLKECFSNGVIGVQENEQGEEEAYVINSRLDTNSRNVFRYDELKDKVRILSVRNHYIFSVESTGAMSPRVIVKEALKLLIKKSTDLRSFLEAPQDE